MMETLHFDVEWSNGYFKFSFDDGHFQFVPDCKLYMISEPETDFVNVGVSIRVDWNHNDNLGPKSVEDFMDKIIALKTS